MPAADPSAPYPVAPLRATLVLLALLLAGVGVLFGVQKAGRRISTDVLELLPRDQLDSTIKLARQTVSGRFGRTLLLALVDPAHPDKPPTEAAAAMAAELRASPAFDDVFTGLKSDDKERLQTWFFERRLALRLPVWLDGMRTRWTKENGAAGGEPDPAWLAAQAAADLQEFQASSDALAYQERLPSDPLLLIPALLSAFGDEDMTTASEVAGGALAATGSDGKRYALLQAEIKASPLTEAGQKPVFRAVAEAFDHARSKFGRGLTMQYTGVNKFAAETRERLESEVGRLTNVSLALSCLLLFIAFRRVTIFVYLLLPIVTATVWSLVVCFALFDRVHLMTIIFTTVLVGVALDYGIYAFSHARQSAGGGMNRALREIRLPLIAGCLTSVGGFVFMTLTNLPMLQQMGVAVALGLLFALGLDFVYLPFIPAPEPDEYVGPTSGKRLSLGGLGFPLLALAALVVAGGLAAAAKVRWSDDVRSLDVMSPELQDEQTFLRGLFGQSKKQRIVLTSGRDLDEAFANAAKFNRQLAAAATRPEDRFVNLGKLLPTADQATRCQAYFRAHPNFSDALRAALDKDFNAGAFAPFFEAWTSWQTANDDPQRPPPAPAQLITGLRLVLPLPLQNLWNEEEAGSVWLATRISGPLYAKLPPGTLAAPNAPIDQVETLNGALRRYRVTAIQRGGIGLGFIAVAVLLVYGWRRAVFMLAIPAVSILLAVAILGFMHQPLGLLHVVALLLGFCLASDYSIFLGSPGELPHSTRRAVLLAASTALLSFVVLSFSRVEALKDICLTVTMVIGFVLVLCEASYRLFVRRVRSTD